jgi:hypothetical protein
MAQVIIALAARQNSEVATAATVKRSKPTKIKKDPAKELDKQIKELQERIADDTKKLNELMKKKAEKKAKGISEKLKAAKIKTSAIRGKKSEAMKDATHTVSIKHKSNAKNALHSVTVSKVGGKHVLQVFSKQKTVNNPGNARWSSEHVKPRLHKTIEIKDSPKGLETAMKAAKKAAESLSKRKMSVRSRMTK